MTKPKYKHEDWDDEDFEGLEDSEDDCECGNYKSPRREMCDQCLFTNM